MKEKPLNSPVSVIDIPGVRWHDELERRKSKGSKRQFFTKQVNERLIVSPKSLVDCTDQRNTKRKGKISKKGKFNFFGRRGKIESHGDDATQNSRRNVPQSIRSNSLKKELKYTKSPTAWADNLRVGRSESLLDDDATQSESESDGGKEFDRTIKNKHEDKNCESREDPNQTEFESFIIRVLDNFMLSFQCVSCNQESQKLEVINKKRRQLETDSIGEHRIRYCDI